jgi:hypothetical protein
MQVTVLSAGVVLSEEYAKGSETIEITPRR